MQSQSTIEEYRENVGKKSLFKQMMPTSLFGRALLIMVIPTVLIQILAMYFFYERHWVSVARHMSSSLAGDIALLVNEVHFSSPSQRQEWQVISDGLLGVKLNFSDQPLSYPQDKIDARFNQFHQMLDTKLGLPFTVHQENGDGNIITRIALTDVIMEVSVSRKRLVSPTTYIFPMWIIATTICLLFIAMMFLRNQIRPIIQLSKAAERFGMGDDDPNFRPRGAKEVRRAGRAFLTMRARISRQIATRTAMLSGISHDLRTPLTRMKLQLAMIKDSKAVGMLGQDIDDMQHMIQEYLDYARGTEGGEDMTKIALMPFLQELVDLRSNHGDNISINHPKNSDNSIDDSFEIYLRKRTFKRALENLITNALRYGGGVCRLSVNKVKRHIEIYIEDEGKGIITSRQEEVFRPFTRLEHSRNANTGGVGLGLTIARDIVQAHGGTINLTNITDDNEQVAGLRATIRLPLRTNKNK